MKKLTVILALFGIWTISLNAQNMFIARQLTFDSAQHGFPTWSPDGNRIAFSRGRFGNSDIWIMDLKIDDVKKDLQMLNK